MKIGGKGNKREWRWKAVRLKGESGSHFSEEWTWSDHWVGWEVLGLSLLRWALSLLIEKLSELIGKTDQLFKICCIGHAELGDVTVCTLKGFRCFPFLGGLPDVFLPPSVFFCTLPTLLLHWFNCSWSWAGNLILIPAFLPLLGIWLLTPVSLT